MFKKVCKNCGHTLLNKKMIIGFSRFLCPKCGKMYKLNSVKSCIISSIELFVGVTMLNYFYNFINSPIVRKILAIIVLFILLMIRPLLLLFAIEEEAKS